MVERDKPIPLTLEGVPLGSAYGKFLIDAKHDEGTVTFDLRTVGLNVRLPPGTTHGFVTQEEELVMLDFHTPGSRPDHDVYFVGSAPDGFTVKD